ncbi:MAG: hypothetical protein HYU66_12030, partial [Armatimonadetes bacterium]|nr:hypothetical protein [Armatimonadota bacterium]
MAAWLRCTAGLLAAVGMLDPSVDRDGAPFEYFAASAARLPSFEEVYTGGPHVLDGGFRITPEGHLACRRGLLAVYLGEGCRPAPWRVKQWSDGVLPISTFDTAFDGVWLRASAWAAPAEGLPGPVGYLRLSLAGTAATQVTRLTLAWISDPGLPVPLPDPPAGRPFAFDSDCALAGDVVLYQFPDLPDAVRWATLDSAYAAPFTAADAAVLSDTPVCGVSYRVARQAGPRR